MEVTPIIIKGRIKRDFARVQILKNENSRQSLYLERECFPLAARTGASQRATVDNKMAATAS